MKNYFVNLEESLIAIFLILMVILIFLATASRYLGIGSITWGEELARYLMIWMTYLGLGVAAKRKAHFTVNAFVEFFPEKIQRYIRIYQLGVVIAFCILVIILSSKIVLIQYGINQTSPSMYLPMWLVYSAIPIGTFLLMFRFAQSVLTHKENDWR